LWAVPQIEELERGEPDWSGQAALLPEQGCSAWPPEPPWVALRMEVLELAAPDGLEQAGSRLEEWRLARQMAPLLVGARRFSEDWALLRQLAALGWPFWGLVAQLIRPFFFALPHVHAR